MDMADVHVHDHVRAGYGSSAASAETHDQIPSEEEDVDLRKGPWTVEEDSVLFDYINIHGEGRWNSLAGHAGNLSTCSLKKNITRLITSRVRYINCGAILN